MRRRDFIMSSGIAAIAWPHAARAQQLAKVYKIGFLALGIGPTTRIAEAFREGLREHGYVQGQNGAVDYRFAEGQIAADLLRLNVDVIVVESHPAALAAKRATSTIPIITAVVADPVASGLVADLARPGGNVTGVTNLPGQLMGKRLELLKQTAQKPPSLALSGSPRIQALKAISRKPSLRPRRSAYN